MAPWEKKRKKKRAGRQQVDHTRAEDDFEIARDLDAVTRARSVNADADRLKKVKGLAKKQLAQQKQKKAEAEHAIKLASDGQTKEMED